MEETNVFRWRLSSQSGRIWAAHSCDQISERKPPISEASWKVSGAGARRRTWNLNPYKGWGQSMPKVRYPNHSTIRVEVLDGSPHRASLGMQEVW